MERTRSTNRIEEECIRDLMANPESRRRVGRSRHIWKDNIYIYIKTGWHDVYWIHFTQDRDQ